MTGIMQVPAASAATGTGFTAGEQVDLTDVAPFGAKQSFAPAAESFSMAVSEQAMRMRVMDGVLKALRMRINGVMEAGAAIPLAERRRQFPFTPMTTGTLLLTRDELMDVQQRINEYLRLSEHRRGSDYEYQVSYAWSLLPSNPAAVVGEDVDAVGPQRMIATTGDHPSRYATAPRQRGQNGTVATRQPFGPCNWGRPSASAHLLACRIAFVYKQLCRLLSPPQSDGELLPVKNGHVPCLLAGFPYIVSGCDYMLTSRAHISQIIPRNMHHSSKHDAVI